MRRATATWAVVPLLAGGLTSCPEVPDAAPVGVAAEADECCIAEVHADPETVHFEGPAWLLASGEGEGPLELDLRVLDFVMPSVTTIGTVKPKPGAISAAVGFDVEERFGVDDFARYTIATGQFKRLEAYTNFQRFAFEIRDGSCGAAVGHGAAYRPIGVYYKFIDAYDVGLPDVHPITFPPPPLPPLPPPPLTLPGPDAAPEAADASSGALGADEVDAGDTGRE